MTADYRAVISAMIAGALKPMITATPHTWIRGWFDLIRSSHSAGGCDAELVIYDRAEAADFDADADAVGWFDPLTNMIGLVLDPIPGCNVSIMIHEVAHWTARRRSPRGRSHGPVWRGIFAEIATELTGLAIGEMAERWRRENPARWGPPPSRQDALDVTVDHAFRNVSWSARLCLAGRSNAT